VFLRLLNLDVDKWVHLNCALWSMEVVELLSGALTNVQAAHLRGLATECCVCKKNGATLGCFKPRCPNKYHVPCAKLKECFFYQDKVSGVGEGGGGRGGVGRESVCVLVKKGVCVWY
jgi:hypothetical protein